MLNNNYDVLTFLRLAFLWFLSVAQLKRRLKFRWSQTFMYLVKMAVKQGTERFAHLTLFYDRESSRIVIPVESNACKRAKEWMLSSFPREKQ